MLMYFGYLSLVGRTTVTLAAATVVPEPDQREEDVVHGPASVLYHQVTFMET